MVIALLLIILWKDGLAFYITDGLEYMFVEKNMQREREKYFDEEFLNSWGQRYLDSFSKYNNIHSIVQ